MSDDAVGGWAGRAASLLKKRQTGLALLLTVTMASVSASNPAFLGAGSISDMLSACAPCVITGCGVALVVICGHIDVSVGSMYGVLAAMMGVLASPTRADLPTAAVVGITLAAGSLFGLVNGVLVGVCRVPAIIATLGMMVVLRGAADILLDGRWVTDLPPSLRAVGTAQWLGLPVGVWTAFAVVALTMWLSARTALGRHIYAVGDNPGAAYLAGIRPRRITVSVFVLGGFLTAVAALVSVPQLSVIDPGLGVGFELLVITAIVVGGVRVEGGAGTILGVVTASVLLGIVRTALIFLKLGPSAAYWERAIHGVFILAAVVLDHVSKRRSPAHAPAVAGPHDEPGAAPRLVPWLLGAVALLGAGAWWSTPSFVTPTTQATLLAQGAELALLVVPMTLIVLTGGIDLSVGSSMALAAVSMGWAFQRGAGVWTSAGVGVATGTACGLVNGLFVSKARIHPLIVTLATMSLFRGLAEGISGGRAVSGFSESFTALGAPGPAGVPAVMLPAALAFVVAGTALWRGVAGRNIRAVGYNETACRYSGIAVDRLKLWLYTVSGSAAGVAACTLIARRNTAKADAGLGIELDVITAVVLGGTSISGGRGSLSGTLIALVLLHEVRQFIAWRWYHDEYVQVVIGVVLIGSVLLERLLRTRRV